MYISINFAQGHSLDKSNSVPSGQMLADIAANNTARIRERTKKLNIALLGSHVAVVLGIVGVISLSYRAPVAEASSNAQAVNSVLEQSTISVDQIAAANVASTVAQTVGMSVEHNVQNLAVSLNAKNDLAQTDNNLLSKPQIVQQNTGRKGITGYTSKAGDTVKSVAAQFGVSEDTIRWANNLTSDTITPDKALVIPGVTGVVYTIKSGDDAAKLADKYKADADRIVTYNDLEISGFTPGTRIVIPDGITPDNERPGYRAPTTYSSGVSVSSSRTGTFGGNGYSFGYCTFYAFNRRAQLGKPIGGNWGNAATWATYARADGFAVDKNPRAGDVFQLGGGWGGLGHVGVVEKVNDDGSLYVSEMNYAGWNVISNRTIPASQAGSYNYIH